MGKAFGTPQFENYCATKVDLVFIVVLCSGLIGPGSVYHALIDCGFIPKSCAVVIARAVELSVCVFTVLVRHIVARDDVNMHVFGDDNSSFVILVIHEIMTIFEAIFISYSVRSLKVL